MRTVKREESNVRVPGMVHSAGKQEEHGMKKLCNLVAETNEKLGQMAGGNEDFREYIGMVIENQKGIISALMALATSGSRKKDLVMEIQRDSSGKMSQIIIKGER